jgi:pSer/pThr/pTyr-binding forkhead associated (FHA) protein
MSTRLCITLPGGKTERIALETQPKVIGRDPKADICIEDRNISRQHCSVAAVPGGVRVQDLGSTNGTFVGGKRVTTAVLKDGEKLQLGELSFFVECDTPPGFGTAVRTVEEQFAAGKGPRTFLGEIAAEAQGGAAGATPPPSDRPPARQG